MNDASDHAAHDALAWAATLAGIAFGNADVHIPHAMAYAVAGLVRDFRMSGYPEDAPMVPHGISVVMSAPSAVRFTASADAVRHLDAAAMLGENVHGASFEDAGEILARALEDLMRRARVPVGLAALGYGDDDVPALTKGTVVQRRLLANAPRDVGEAELAALFRGALRDEAR